MYDTAPFDEFMDEYPVGIDAFPPGLVGDIANYFLAQSPRPVATIALVGSIALLSGIIGQRYQVSGTGTNGYYILLAYTGAGKEAVNQGISKVASVCPSVADYIGGDVRSDAAFLKQLAKKPSAVYILTEFSHRFERMHGRRANPIDVGIKRVWLDAYGKSSKGNKLQPTLYSDDTKSTVAIDSPAASFIAEGVPDHYYDTLDDETISSGLVSRFTHFVVRSERPDLNENAGAAVIPQSVIDGLTNLTARVASLAEIKQFTDVGFTPEAASFFGDLNIYCDHHIRGSRETKRQLFNRGHLKSMKLAAVAAVGFNHLCPVIDLHMAVWAAKIVLSDIHDIAGRFERGDVGEVDGNEIVQSDTLKKAIRDYVTEPYVKYTGYHGGPKLHDAKVFTLAFLMQKLRGVKTFKNDRLGPSKAIDRAIRHLLDGDQIREIPKRQMQEDFGTGARAFVVSDARSFV